MTDLHALGNALADEIEKNGHYQGTYNKEGGSYPACIIVNPAWSVVTTDYDNIQRNLLIAIEGVRGVDAPIYGLALRQDIYEWNDNTPTEEVVRVLRNLPAS